MEYHDLLQAEIGKQREIYLALKAGQQKSVFYQPYQDKKYGTQDANYQNRLRLAYYLLYEKVEDEEIIFWLFQEELKDREMNSFQGIGSTVEILTFLLQKYNVGQKYDAWFARVKNANFDCACGYDPALPVCETLADNNLLDCVYLCEELGYREVMETLVAWWKDSVTEWNDGNRADLIRFYSFLGKDEENEVLYLEQLSSAERAGKTGDVVFAYNKLIRYDLDCGKYQDAHHYLDEVRKAVEYQKVKSRRMFGDLLEEAAETICKEREAGSESEKETGEGHKTDELWEWTKKELTGYTNWYGNLYIKSIAAAKAMDDPYAAQLEKAYKAWCRKTKLK